MKTFWIILLVAFLVFFIIAAIRGRHYSNAVYRARFRSRMPQRGRQPEPTSQDSLYMVPVIYGSTIHCSPAPHSAPDCTPGVADASGGCSAGADGGGGAS